MNEYVTALNDDEIRDLQALFNIVEELENGAKKDGFMIEYLVAMDRGVKVEIFSDEHPPPHFRVKYQGSTANYSIDSCKRLNGSGPILTREKLIRLWWSENKSKLIEVWNERRPDGCPVGKYDPPEQNNQNTRAGK